jgi:hypothetical protein
MTILFSKLLIGTVRNTVMSYMCAIQYTNSTLTKRPFEENDTRDFVRTVFALNRTHLGLFEARTILICSNSFIDIRIFV